VKTIPITTLVSTPAASGTRPVDLDSFKRKYPRSPEAMIAFQKMDALLMQHLKR